MSLSLGGLISGVMGPVAKGAAVVADKQLDASLKDQLLQAEHERTLRADEIKRERDLADIPRKNDATMAATVAQAANQPYLTAKGKLAAADETPGQKTTRETAELALKSARQLAGLREKLSTTTDTEQRSVIEQQIYDLTTGSKTFTDVVAGAKILNTQAKELRGSALQLEGAAAEQAISDAEDLEKFAAELIKSVAGRRLGKANAKPGAKPTQTTVNPWDKKWSSPADDNLAP